MSTKSAEVAVMEPSHGQQSLAVLTPMDMLSRAVEHNAPMEVLEKLMALQERWDATQARKAFVEAFAAFKSETITIVRNKKVTDGPLKGKSYAELFSFVDAVTPALSRHGLSASWAITRDEKDWIDVTCTIEHVLGHAKHVTMGGPPDVGGAKNAIQSRASTVTYLERHTLKAACGISEQGDDPDGRANGSSGPITDAQAKQITDLITATKSDVGGFLKWAGAESVSDIPASRFNDCIGILKAKQRKGAAS